MRKMFELSRETGDVLKVMLSMTVDQQMTFRQLSAAVGFAVKSTSSCYQAAKRIAERDHGVYIGTNRGVGFFRGNGDDMADSLEPMAKRMRRVAKRSIERADLAVRQNLSDDRYERVVERRSRASLIYSTSAAHLPASNRKRPEPATEAPQRSPADALRRLA